MLLLVHPPDLPEARGSLVLPWTAEAVPLNPRPPTRFCRPTRPPQGEPPNLHRRKGPLGRLRRTLAPSQNPRIGYDRPGRPKGPSRGTQDGASLAQMVTTGRPAVAEFGDKERSRPTRFLSPGAVVLFARGTSLATSAG
jgi:hypothetical protein